MTSPAKVRVFLNNKLPTSGYILVHFSRGSLPWLVVRGETNKQQYEKILEKKNYPSDEELCKGLPMEFMKYCKSLGFYKRPD